MNCLSSEAIKIRKEKNNIYKFTVMYRHEPKAELSAWVAQLVKHLTWKQGVIDSIPTLGKWRIVKHQAIHTGV